MDNKYNFGRLQTPSEPADESAIRNLSHVFSDSVNRRDFALCASIWTENATWVIEEPFPLVAVGRKNITSSVQVALLDWAFFVQQLHSGIVQVDGNRAVSSWTVQETARNAEGTRFYNNFGLYEDELEKRDEIWGFTKRTYRYIWFDTTSEIRGQVVPPAMQLVGGRSH